MDQHSGLANWGHRLMLCRADVIKIEHPTRGDDTRAWGPPYAKYTQGEHSDGPGESAYYLAVSLQRCRSR